MQHAKDTPRSLRDRARTSIREIALALVLTFGALAFIVGVFGPTH